MDLQDLFLQHCARSWDKQMALSALLGTEHRWDFNLNSGKLTFNERLSYDTQLIGTEAYESNTWLWAWANSLSDISEGFLVACNRLRQYGAEHNITPLTQPTLVLDEWQQGHVFTMIACGLYAANAYYRATYEGGALFVVIKDPAFPPVSQHPIERIALLFPQLIAGMSVPDHRLAFIAYLKSYGLRVGTQDNAVIGQHRDGTQVRAVFDGQQRLAKLATTLGG